MLSREVTNRDAVDVIKLSVIRHTLQGFVQPFLDLIDVLLLCHPVLDLVQLEEYLLHLILED